MKLNLKSKILILIISGILIAFSPIFTTNPSFTARDRDITSNYNDEFDHENLKISAVSGKIYIDGNSGWAAFKAAGNCTGNGTYAEPYVIEDLVIDGEGSGSCILIENSDVYFRIENCTNYNSGNGYGTGIRLSAVNNSQLIDNNCSSNYRGIYLSYSDNNNISGNTANGNNYGIYLYSSDNNNVSGNTANNNEYGIFLFHSNYDTISGNTANNNTQYGIRLYVSNDNTISGNTVNNNQEGIRLYVSNDNTISGNTANNNTQYGIALSGSNNTVSGNIMNECGLGIHDYLEMLVSNDIDTTNLVNGKLLYYYTNEVNLGLNNFTNAGQVILVNCNDSLISNLNTSYCSIGISLYYSDNNNISGNTANNNTQYGIILCDSDYNNISGNTANNNTYGIILYLDCDENEISGNTANNNTYGIILSYICDENEISGNTVNNNQGGIWLYVSNDNTISGNTVNNNQEGIRLYVSNDNTISGNILIGNEVCINETGCEGNKFKDNEYCDYGEGDGDEIIPGYDLFFLLGILSVVAILISKKVKKS